MFSNDQKIDAANDLLREAKQYADLRLQRLKLDFVSKLTLLLSGSSDLASSDLPL